MCRNYHDKIMLNIVIRNLYFNTLNLYKSQKDLRKNNEMAYSNIR